MTNKESEMNENEFWITFWKIAGAVVVTVVLSVGGCTAYEAKLVSAAVKSGIDPIAARCGISGRGKMGSICSIQAAKRD